jgi:hypothetical protein
VSLLWIFGDCRVCDRLRAEYGAESAFLARNRQVIAGPSYWMLRFRAIPSLLDKQDSSLKSLFVRDNTKENRSKGDTEGNVWKASTLENLCYPIHSESQNIAAQRQACCTHCGSFHRSFSPELDIEKVCRIRLTEGVIQTVFSGYD